MSNTDPNYLDVMQKWKELGTLASDFQPAKLPVNCEGHDFRAIVKDLEQLVGRVDGLVSAYGDYVKANSSGRIELRLFQDQLGHALEGSAFYEVECVAEQADEEAAELETEKTP